jgi:phenylalanyl-tRNA synthetase beta chain
MKVPLKWLADYVALTLPTAELARRLTLSTAEVEAIEQVGGDWDLVRVGRVLEVGAHPNADRLRLATVDVGGEPKTVVCGAPNLERGQRIAFAEVGAHLIDGHSGQPMQLKASTIRGVVSAGMVCSERELGLSEEHEGILVLPEDAPVGVPLRDYLGDSIFDIYSWPHRPDLMSMVGIAREVGALIGEVVHPPAEDCKAEAGPMEGRLGVRIEAPELCGRYIGAVVEGVTVGPSPKWMQQRLEAAGMRPINNVVDITNYVMLELGQPLHAFDYERVVDRQIIVRRAKDGERLLTLDGEERQLDPRMLVICDPAGPVALAGVMGGLTTEVSQETRTILLEAANFNGINIRSTSTRLRLRSEASARFEKSISPEVAIHAARRAVRLMVELCGGRAVDGFVDEYPGERPPVAVDVSAERICTVLGVEMEPERVRGSLQSLGFVVEGGPPENYRVIVPYWRTDVGIPDDVIEEIIRVVGYETVPLRTISGRLPDYRPEQAYELRRLVQDRLVESGLQEVITYSLVSERLAEEEDSAEEHLRIVNPASRDHLVLRRSLTPSLLQVLAANLRRRSVAVGLFEAARTYIPQAGELPKEPEVATGILAGRRPDRWGMPSDEPVDFFDAKGIVEAVLDGLQVDASFEPAEADGMVAGHTARILSSGRSIGIVGQLHPELLRRFDIEDEAYLFELSLGALSGELGTKRGYRPFSRFPAIREDLALVVDRQVTALQLETIIRRGRYVVDARVFDVYSGSPIPEGQKSIAFAVEYQSPDKTLSEEEVRRSRERTLLQLQQQVGASLRDV